MAELNVERRPDSGQCGEVGDIGGSLPGQTEKFRRNTQCRADAEYQVFADTEPPEDAMIVSACEDHIEDAKEFVEDHQE